MLSRTVLVVAHLLLVVTLVSQALANEEISQYDTPAVQPEEAQLENEQAYVPMEENEAETKHRYYYPRMRYYYQPQRRVYYNRYQPQSYGNRYAYYRPSYSPVYRPVYRPAAQPVQYFPTSTTSWSGWSSGSSDHHHHQPEPHIPHHDPPHIPDIPHHVEPPNVDHLHHHADHGHNH